MGLPPLVMGDGGGGADREERGDLLGSIGLVHQQLNPSATAGGGDLEERLWD